MKYSEDIKGLSYFKAHASELINDIYENHKTMIITQNGEAKVVVQDIKEYEKNEETMAMLKLVAIGEKEIRDGKYKPIKEAFLEIKERTEKYAKSRI